MIGTGASAIQFIPAIAPQVEKLTVFQRSAAYVLPKPDKTYPRWQKFLFSRLPGALRLSRALIYLHHEVTAFAFVDWPAALRVKLKAFRRHLQDGVKDPERQRRLLPHYRIGCKRILLSNDFYPAMDRPNVELVTEGIREVRSDAIVTWTAASTRSTASSSAPVSPRPTFLAPIRITGVGRDLRQCWRDGAQAHLGITVAGFPNFFMLYGPNTNLAHNSIVYMLECQIRYVVACLRRLCSAMTIRTLEVRPGGPGPFQRAPAGAPEAHRVGQGLHQLVPDRRGPEHEQLARLYLRVRLEDPRAAMGRVCCPIARSCCPPGVRERIVAPLLRGALTVLLKPALSPRLPIARAALVAASARAAEPAGARRRDRARDASAASRANGCAATSNGNRTILYLHGGGFCTGSPATHRALTSRLARATGLPVFAADYRLAPEHPFPAALEDAMSAYRALSGPDPSSSRAIPPARGWLW